MSKPPSPWNSLEATKVGISLLTPLIVGFIAFIAQDHFAKENASQVAQRRLLERRLQIHDQVSGELNRIYCFIEDVGSWKSDSPKTVIGHKRKVDATMHANRAVWSKQTFDAYVEYIDAIAFATYEGGLGRDAKIRTHDKEKRVGIAEWNSGWGARLTGEKHPEHRSKYSTLQDLISRDLVEARPVSAVKN